MLNKSTILAEDLSQRLNKGKQHTYLFIGGIHPKLITQNSEFIIHEYILSIYDDGGNEYKGNFNSNTPDTLRPPFSILFDNNGVGENQVRFILYNEDDPILSSTTDVHGTFVAIASKKDSDKLFAVAFAISNTDNGKLSICVSGGDEVLVQYLRIANA